MTLGSIAITSNTPREDLLIYAINEVNNLLPGEEFKLCDLFIPYEWKRLPVRGMRSVLGTDFFNHFFNEKNGVSEGRGLLQTRHGDEGKSLQGQRIYKKI